jgi:hypothetical protein
MVPHRDGVGQSGINPERILLQTVIRNEFVNAA